MSKLKIQKLNLLLPDKKATLTVSLVGMCFRKTGATHYYAEKGRAIKGLVFCNGWEVELLDLQNLEGYTHTVNI